MSRGDGGRFQPHRRIRRWLGPIFGVSCFLATLTGVVVLIVLMGAIVFAALAGPPHHPWYDVRANAGELLGLLSRLVSNRQSSDPSIAGFRVGLAGSLWLMGLVAVIGIPVGVGAAVFLEEYAPPGRAKRIIQTNIANLAGVPSIVYGILGLALFVRAFGFRGLAMGPSLLAGAFTLGLLILPVIVITTQEALRTVPNSLRQAAVGFLKTLSREVAADGVTVNTVVTGKFATDRLAESEGSLENAERSARETVPAKRLGLPEEFGDLVAFLASDRAAYITGTTIPIDGGLLRSV